MGINAGTSLQDDVAHCQKTLRERLKRLDGQGDTTVVLLDFRAVMAVRLVLALGQWIQILSLKKE